MEFWWCLKRRGPEMFTFGVLGLLCRRGFTQQPESPNVHISGFGPSKTPPEFHEKNPTRGIKTPFCFCGECQVSSGSVVHFVSHDRSWEGTGRQWVLENDLSEAVWRTTLRGPRPPSVVWPRGSDRSSVSTKGPGGLNQGRPPHQQSVKSRASKGLAKPAVSPPSVRLSPDERVAEARARVARLEAALQVLGETSFEAQPIQKALRKAREQCRVKPVGETVSFAAKQPAVCRSQCLVHRNRWTSRTPRKRFGG